MGPNEQSIEDILASIRKVIVEEPAAPQSVSVQQPAGAPHSSAAADDDVLELDRPLDAAAFPQAPAPAAPPPPAPRAALVAPETADASRLALSALSQLRLKGGDPADDTLAGLVREMLRPMLKEWLDAELPAIVERLVLQEIARLTAPRD